MSLSSDLSLSPCSKNSLVTSSATCYTTHNHISTRSQSQLWCIVGKSAYLTRYLPGFSDGSQITRCHQHRPVSRSQALFTDINKQHVITVCVGECLKTWTDLHMSLCSFTFQLYSPLFTSSKNEFLFLWMTSRCSSVLCHMAAVWVKQTHTTHHHHHICTTTHTH